MFLAVRRCFFVCNALLLIALFLLPIRYLRDTEALLREDLALANEALEQGDAATAADACSRLCGCYASRSIRLKWFLNHSAVDAAALCFASAATAAKLGDCVSAACSLSDAEQALKYMLGVESFDFNAFL